MISLDELDLKGKRVLIRLDLNVSSTDPEDIAHEDRVQAALPTIEYVIEKGGKAILMSHKGRPKGKFSENDKLEPVAIALGGELGMEVTMAPDCIGESVETLVEKMQDGDVILLENLRFHAGEEANDPEFVQSLAKLGDVYLDDAFGTAHRKHASTYGVPKLFRAEEKAIGLLMKKEIDVWSKVLKNEGPKYLCLGGAKLKEKIAALERLSPQFDKVYIGGLVYNAVRASQGRSVGKSKISEKKDPTDYVAKVKKFLPNLENLVLPDQLVIAKAEKKKEGEKEVTIYLDEKTIAETDNIPDDYLVVDCIYGQEKLQQLEQTKLAVAFGPLGVFEDPRFAKGSDTMAEAFNNARKSILGGGESGTAYKKSTKAYVSTGGGASIEFLLKAIECKELPAIEALK